MAPTVRYVAEHYPQLKANTMPLPSSMNPLQHVTRSRSLGEKIARQCTPEASGASDSACEIVRSLLTFDGMSTLKTEDTANTGFFAHLCRRVDINLTVASSDLVSVVRDLIGCLEEIHHEQVEMGTPCDDTCDYCSTINNAQEIVQSWQNQ